jgi:NADPH:quinone reductase-like Zn-dependent oxidoreductase
MRAALIREHGGPEVLEIAGIADPVPGHGQVVVDVGAAALNHLDLWVRRGLPGLELAMPHVGGADVAGTVSEIGPGVEGWSPGDRVVVNPGLWCGRCEWCVRGEHSLCERYGILGEHVQGGLAEKVRVPATSLYPLPESVEFDSAAAVPLVFQTAWRGLITRAGLAPGETVLITGGSGGVSTAAIQIAALAGARVIAVTSGPEKAERVRELGAHDVIDRLEEDFSRATWEITDRRGVDVVLDSVGEATWEGCVRALARDGRLVTYGATTGAEGRQDIRRMFWKQIRIIGTTMASRSEFEHVMALVFAGRLRPVVDVVWPLDRVREAHERLEAGEGFGKIVLVP